MKLVIVSYGKPESPEAFDRHYADVHVPLVRAMPQLLGFEHSRGPIVGDGDTPYLIAILRFASEDALQTSMASPEGKAAVDDLKNFASGGVSVLTADAVARV